MFSACLPTIRPACLFLTTCTNPASTRGSSANTFAESYERSRNKKSIRLSTMAKDETSSTHELAGRSESNGGSFSDPEIHMLDSYPGNVATITSPTRVRHPDGYYGNPANAGGIMVENETVVRVSPAKNQKR
ncbi:hypothetical protein FSARC_10931 [Fusarium sarcochroum]|uniref:Uncharacterized protein n=1 Tax=Fusarium sarcochroum TaxID=1208366 RepID=A0A8H4TIU5_9HYPO|nr:hypothetical protein FSARC_10931 [Fusarium sarcochroum]